MTTAYPLQWPADMPRTKTPVASRFSSSVASAVKNVMDELKRFGKDTGSDVSDIVISSNVSLTDQRPDDPGVVAYFRWDNIDCAIAIDRYKRPEENLQAIARIIEAERTKMRHGGLNIVRAGFRGYAALPPPKDPKAQITKPWWQTLGFTNSKVTLADAEQAYKRLVKQHHPDRGGDPVIFNQITDAIRQRRETA